MIPKWQMGAMLAAAAALLAFAIYTSPYGEAMRSGACSAPNPPPACRPNRVSSFRHF